MMPFGLHNVPATFQWMMDYLLRDCQDFPCANIDDIAVYSHSWEGHMSDLQQVFNQLQLEGLTVKLEGRPSISGAFGLLQTFYPSFSHS